ncbi:MAG: glycosyltransferase family 2 protein [bacterium]|nr:glycosyltransferase family 2 protein [bacterium]
MAPIERMPNIESISVVIPTRNRNESVGRAIDAVLHNRDPDFRIVVVDQSDDERTESLVARYDPDPRFSYVREPGRGASLGRNVGADRAQGDLLLFTDDDCTVPPDWLGRARAAFSLNSRIGMILGNVAVAGPPNAEGFVTGHNGVWSALAKSSWDRPSIEALGACMGLRREVWKQLGGLDEVLGAGSRFRSGEETDLVNRVLGAGHWVYQSADWRTIHHGWQTWEDQASLVSGYLYGIGAVHGKFLRRQPAIAIKMMSHLAFRWVFSNPGIQLGSVPPRTPRLRAFCRGLTAGLGTPVDHSTGKFVAEARASEPSGETAGQRSTEK